MGRLPWQQQAAVDSEPQTPRRSCVTAVMSECPLVGAGQSRRRVTATTNSHGKATEPPTSVGRCRSSRAASQRGNETTMNGMCERAAIGRAQPVSRAHVARVKSTRVRRCLHAPNAQRGTAHARMATAAACGSAALVQRPRLRCARTCDACAAAHVSWVGVAPPSSFRLSTTRLDAASRSR